MNKQEKVNDINQAIRRSSVAVQKRAQASLLKDGRIEYSSETATRSGHKYRAKTNFMGILRLLHGEDMRRLHAKYGR